MKKMKIILIVFAILLFMPNLIFAQWDNDGSGNIYYNNGKVRIGDGTFNALLSIFENNNNYNGTLELKSIKGSNISHVHYGPNGNWYIRSANNNGSVIIQDAGGFVGLGTSSPQEKLHIKGNMRIDGQIKSWGNFIFKPDVDKSGDDFYSFENKDEQEIMRLSSNILQIKGSQESQLYLTNSNSNKSWQIVGPIESKNNTLEFNYKEGSTYWAQAAISGGGMTLGNAWAWSTRPPANGLLVQGNVGIGETNPQYKLAVNGTIKAKEILVDIAGWSDFVFKKDYNLKPLKEVEKHIKDNGHLPEMPSEKEILKNGYNLGEMDAKLLQKIEELTLYMIEIKKENEELKKAIKKGKKYETK